MTYIADFLVQLYEKVLVVSFVLYGLFNIGVFEFYLLLAITMY
jgi:hypothetical protein